MSMREDCVHYESRTYDDDGETARFCTLDLAPEAPWRCPEHCPRYERLSIVSGDFETGSLGRTPPVEDEPDGDPDDIAAVLDDAEDIVNAAAADALDAVTPPRRRWWRRRRGERDDGDDAHFGRRHG